MDVDALYSAGSAVTDRSGYVVAETVDSAGRDVDGSEPYSFAAVDFSETTADEEPGPVVVERLDLGICVGDEGRVDLAPVVEFGDLEASNTVDTGELAAHE